MSKRVTVVDAPPQESSLPASEIQIYVNNPFTADHQPQDLGERRGTLIGTYMSCCCTVVGAGILGLPAAIASVGYVSGAILFVVGAGASQVGNHFIAKTCDKVGGDQTSFSSCAAKINPWFAFVVNLLVWFLMFFVGILYAGTAADFLVDAAAYINPTAHANNEWYVGRTFLLTLVWGGLSAPLCFPRKMTILQYTSTASSVFVIYTLVLVVYYAFQPRSVVCESFLARNNATCVDDRCCLESGECCIGEVVAFNGTFLTFLQSLAILATSFCCAVQIFLFYNDLQNPTVKRLNTATGSAMLTCAVLYTIISFGGYFTFGDAISSDLLSGYPLSLDVTICRIGIAFLVAVSYPLVMVPCRDESIFLVGFLTIRLFGIDITDPTTKRGNITYYVALITVLVTTYGVALAGLDMGTILNIVGSISTCNISFTIPSIFYWVYYKDDGLTFMRLLCIPVGILGLSIMLFNIVTMGLGIS